MTATSIAFISSWLLGSTAAGATGTITPTCAPYDGPAFQIASTLPTGRNLVLTGYDAISKAAGTWVIRGGAEQGAASAIVCDPGKRTIDSCSFATSGSFTVRSSGRSLTVSYTLHLTHGRDRTDLTGQLNANPADSQSPADPLFCG